jgi:hypothetical protein
MAFNLSDRLRPDSTRLIIPGIFSPSLAPGDGLYVPAGESVANRTCCLADRPDFGCTVLSAATFLLSPSFSGGLGHRRQNHHHC